MVKPALKVLLIIPLLANGYLAGAKSADRRTSLNNLQESFDQLITIKNSQLLLNERGAIELVARTAVFNRVLDLANEELSDLKKKLEKLSNPDRLQHLNNIKEYQSYHETVRGQINREIDLKELVDIAAKFKQWRETVYNKEIEKTINFVLVFQTQEAIKTAENRLDRIMRDFKIIKSYLMPNEWGVAEKLVDDAKNLIKEAKKINVEAQTSFNEVGIQTATQKIAAAYKNFIAISDMVK